MNLIHLFDDVTRRLPEQAALIEGLPGKGRQTTFIKLYNDSCHLAALFNSHGLKPGHHLLIALPMSSTLYTVIAAAFRCGLVPVFIDPSRGTAFVRQVLSRLTIHALVASHKAMWLGLIYSSLRNVRYKFVDGYFPGTLNLKSARHLTPDTSVVECTEDTPALITFTSGSTGIPKGVIRSHGNLLHSNHMLSAMFELAPASIHLACMPIMVLNNLTNGIGSLLPAVPLSGIDGCVPRKLIRQIEGWRPVSTVITPGLLSLLTSTASQNILNSFTTIIVGGAPLMPSELEKIHSLAPNATIKVLYGSTEAEPIATISFQEITKEDITRMNTGYGLLVGHPGDGVELRIIHQQPPNYPGRITQNEFETLMQKNDSIGEIIVTGAHVVNRYLDSRSEEKEFIHVGSTTWLRTGDAGRLDERDRLWLMGRCTARVRDGESSYYPLAVEPAISLISGIKRSAYLQANGKKVLVIETTEPSVPEQSFLNHVIQQLSGVVVDELIVVKRIPIERRLHSKTDYPQLRKLLENGKYLMRFNI